MLKRSGILTCVVILTFAAVGSAQTGPDNDPDAASGYVNSSFQHGSADSINLYNGQLTIPVPLGPSYSIGSKLKFQAIMTYNSRVWDYGHPLTQEPDFTYAPLVGDPALGIGWTFTLGAIKSCSQGRDGGMCYFAPDGSQHIFNSIVAGGTAKTLDGSQFLLHDTGNQGPYEMWDGDGNHYVFTRHVTGFDDVQSVTGYVHDFGIGRDGWYLTSVSDPFNNTYSISYYSGITKPCWSYPSAGCSGRMQMQCHAEIQNTWIPQTITLPGGYTIDIGQTNGSITSLAFPKSPSAKASWTIQYAADDPMTKGCSGVGTETVNLKEISSIVMPADIPGSPSYTFTYLCGVKGYLTTVKLPTGTQVDYTYGNYSFHHGRIGALEPGCSLKPPPPDFLYVETSFASCGIGYGNRPTRQPNIPGRCDDNNDLRWLDTQLGVVQRDETVPHLTATGTTQNVIATTQYEQYAFPYGEQGTSPSSNCDPLGRCGSQTLTVVLSPPDVDGKIRAKGVLFAAGPKTNGGYTYAGDRTGAQLEERVYGSWPTSPATYCWNCYPVCGGSQDLPFCANHASRVTQWTYDYDDTVNQIHNRRLLSEITYHGTPQANDQCPGCKYHRLAYSNAGSDTWEGNGRHYDVETHTGTLGGTINRTITTTWTPSVSPWQPNLFNHRTEVEGSSMLDQRFEFTATGFPRGESIYDVARRTVYLTCRYADTAGNVAKDFSARYPNRDAPGVNTCFDYYSEYPTGGVGVNGDAFGKTYTHQNGLLLSARWMANATTPAGWFLRNYSRDAATGRVTSSSDTAGLSTSYGYDSIGRVTSVTPPGGEAATTVSYPSAIRTTVSRNGGTGLSTFQQYDYDGLGRVIRETRLMPGAAYSKRFTLYDPAGDAYFSSEWIASTAAETVSADIGGTCGSRPSSAPGEYRNCFDPFGRPQQVVGASHSSLTTINRNDGSSLYSDTVEAVTSWCVNGTRLGTTCTNGIFPDPVTTRQKDGFGRITSVTEPGGDSPTTYGYNVSGKLTSVNQGLQPRTFAYDAAGFLRSESTPEKGTVTYDDYGSLGNVLAETQPGGLSLSRTYDFAGRLTGVLSGATRYLTSCYDGQTCSDGGTGGGTYKLGKLSHRIGYNYLLGTTAGPKTVEDFIYSDPTGRISSRAVAIGNGGSNLTAAESWTYNGLGLESTYNHPRSSGFFTVTPGYDAGFPVTVSAAGQPVVTSASYQSSGALASYRTSNGVTTTIQQDGVLPRPSRIYSSSAGFDINPYSYDGVGNIKKMGSDIFAYDSRSRLTSATLSGFSPRSLSYDRYGNLTQKGATTYTVNALTNRLSSTSPGGSAVYDARGNLTTYGPETLRYDALDRQYEDVVSGVTWDYVYDGAGERQLKLPGSNTVLRREMAKFVIQARGEAPATGCGAPLSFTDVPCSDPDWGWIEKMKQDGLTNGCTSSTLFCPNASLTRAQMAKFIVLARYETAVPNSQCLTFNRWSDVPCTYSGPENFWGYIERIYLDAITTGCGYTGEGQGGRTFCPDSTLNELQIMTFMTRGWPSFQPVPRQSTYTLRDAQNRVATEFYETAAGRDNIYLGNLLVGTNVSDSHMGTIGWQFYSSDHLGTPRQITSNVGAVVASPKYWPFGEPTATSTDSQRLRFASMERDTESNRYYDHARSHEFNLGRFLSPDKVGGRILDPQSWNRYAYARNNPLILVDPNGEDPTIFQDAAAKVQEVADAAAVVAQSFSGAPGGLGEGMAQGAGLIDLAARTLNLGTNTGEAIGSGADAFSLTNAISSDVLTASEFTLAVAGTAKSLGADTTKVVHFTNDANLARFEASGQLRGGANATFVTKPGEVKGLTASQIETKLGIGSGKGQNSISLRVKNSNLRVPDNGPTTQGGAWQRQLNQPCSIQNACIERVPN